MSDLTTNKQKPISQGTQNEIGYSVEVRCEKILPMAPIKLFDGFVTTEWRKVNFEQSNNSAGVPVNYLYSYKNHHGLLSYEGAVALAWTIIAQNEWAHRLEARVVSYKLTTTWEVNYQGIVDNSFPIARVETSDIVLL